MPTTRRALSLLTLTAATALALTACFGGPQTVTPGEEVETVPEGSETVVDAIEFPEPEASAAGQTLAFGEPAWIPIDFEGTPTFVGAAVLDIVEGDPSFFEMFSNADEFEGFVPYYVFVQRAWTDEEHRGDLTLWPVFADLTDANYIETTTYGLGTLTACGDFPVPEFENPNVEIIDCFVAASNTGEPVAGVRYDSTSKWSVFAPSGNPYYDAPIFWMAG